MPKLTLVREASSDYFPSAVKDLVHLLRDHTDLQPAVFDFLLWMKPDDDASQRRRALKKFFRQYRRLNRLAPSIQEKVATVLEDVYSLTIPGVDPRGLVVEYLVYVCDNFGIDPDQERCQKDYQCSVRRKGLYGKTERLTDSPATFDVAWLSRHRFAGYECKLRLSNFMRKHGSPDQLSDRAQRKLQFLQDVAKLLQGTGRTSQVVLIGLDRDPEETLHLLKDSGYDVVQVLSSRDLERALAS